MISRLYSWYGKAVVNSIFAVVALLIVAGFVLTQNPEEETQNVLEAREVTVASVASFSNDATIDVIGTVSATREATIQSEAAGQVTRVNVALGDRVTAGQIIGQIENASERAQVLSAQGAYEAALAAAAQADSGVQSAETALAAAKTAGVSTFRSAFTTTDDAIRNTIDILFSNPTGAPGFRLDGLGQATSLNTTRQTIEGTLRTWSIDTTEINTANAKEKLENMSEDMETVSRFVETLAQVAANENNDEASIDGTSIGAIRSSITGVRTALNGTKQSIQNALTGIINAEEALTRATISGTTGEQSSANAAVKQALGALRGAEANLEKTLFRAPITGNINVLDIKVGDFVSSFTPVAQITNDSGFEVKTSVSESERARIQVGDRVQVDGVEGVVTALAPAVNPTTKKVEVRIAVDGSDLKSGDTVRVVIPTDTTTTNASDTRITVPVPALKVETDRIIVFTVENNQLVAHEITEGPLVGSNIIILDGLTPDMVIVTDARGLNEGDQVKVTAK